MNAIDVYAYGMVSKSTLYRLEGPLPAPDAYGELAGAFAQIGGEAAKRRWSWPPRRRAPSSAPT